MRRIFILALAAAAGCASTPADMDAAADSWLGANYDDVVARWGTPVRSSGLSDGRAAYTWTSEGPASRGAVWPSIGIFGGSGGIGVGAGATVGPGGVGLVRCERTLIFRGGRVVEHAWQGDTDYCASFRRG